MFVDELQPHLSITRSESLIGCYTFTWCAYINSLALDLLHDSYYINLT